MLFQLRYSKAIISTSLTASFALFLASAVVPQSPAPALAVSAARLRAHVGYLASPDMKGRASGTVENDRAAAYVATQFRKAGITPANGKSYFQAFSVTVGAGLGPANSLKLNKPEMSRELALKTDYLPLNISDSGEAALKLVFAGYGISSEEHRYDDYLHMDVQGKAVIVLRHEPREDDPQSPFAGRELTTHADIVHKAINARNHGARALILVNDPVPHAAEEDVLIKFGTLQGPENAGILLVQASQAAVNQWIAPLGKTLGELQKTIDDKLQPQSAYVPDLELTLRVDVQRHTARTKNVAGWLRGSDPVLSKELVIIGAHFDHLGHGTRGSLAPSQVGKIHPGADDNASGTASLLEIAAALSARRGELKRSVLLLAFSGEELGLLGSAHYTKAPLWPLENTVAMINLDMVGRPRDGKITVGGAGTSPGFRDLIRRINATGLEVSFSDSGYGRSDHSSFYVKNIPVLFFFSGLHADYHKPTDTADRLLYADHARVTGLALAVAAELANAPERPAYVRVQEPQQPSVSGGGSGYGAYFGSIPDMGEEVNGVKFADIREGSPAAQAGLKAGDILISFAGKDIKNLYDFTYALRAHKPGEEVSVTVLRGSEKLTVSVKLAQRK